MKHHRQPRMIWRFLMAFVPCFAFIYLAWIGAQFIVESSVEFGAVDIGVTGFLAWFAARDVIAIVDKLHRSTAARHAA